MEVKGSLKRKSSLKEKLLKTKSTTEGVEVKRGTKAKFVEENVENWLHGRVVVVITNHTTFVGDYVWITSTMKPINTDGGVHAIYFFCEEDRVLIEFLIAIQF